MDAVLFDLFGTLIPNVEPGALRSGLDDLARLFGADPEVFWVEWGKTFPSRMDGSVRDGIDVFRPTLEALGLSPSAVALEEAHRMRRDFFLGQLRPKRDALETLDALLERGCRLGLVTDCSSDTPALLDRTPLGPYFPVRAVSAELRTRKPDPVMYHTVLDDLGVPAERALYVGDGNSEELPGAKRLGLTTVWVDNGDAQHWHDRFVGEADFTVRRLREIPLIVDRLREPSAEGGAGPPIGSTARTRP
jgi:putative hydrolase of the HAD superfamily